MSRDLRLDVGAATAQAAAGWKIDSMLNSFHCKLELLNELSKLTMEVVGPDVDGNSPILPMRIEVAYGVADLYGEFVALEDALLNAHSAQEGGAS